MVRATAMRGPGTGASPAFGASLNKRLNAADTGPLVDALVVLPARSAMSPVVAK